MPCKSNPCSVHDSFQYHSFCDAITRWCEIRNAISVIGLMVTSSRCSYHLNLLLVVVFVSVQAWWVQIILNLYSSALSEAYLLSAQTERSHPIPSHFFLVTSLFTILNLVQTGSLFHGLLLNNSSIWNIFSFLVFNASIW